ncbi:MAG: ATP-binding cassette domain-containing protein [Tissierellia bacterium]|nr:ATP-binding cassette domain-containing protein [Tissierellia bacterium]
MEILRCEHVKKFFPMKGSKKSIFGKPDMVKAVNDVSFVLKEGETLGIVGESGSGKSTLARCIMRLYDNVEGKIELLGKDITHLSQKELRPYRKHMQMIFQDPYSSLNPRMTAGEIIGENLKNQGNIHGAELRQRTLETMELCGLSKYHYPRYPHEFSGGQRQRISIARALITNPKLVIADEPTSALDVSIQAQIINLLKDLQDELSLSYIFISHDLAVVEHISTKVAVMYLGKIVEAGEKEEIYHHPKHEYTKTLLSAIPISHPGMRKNK